MAPALVLQSCCRFRQASNFPLFFPAPRGILAIMSSLQVKPCPTAARAAFGRFARALAQAVAQFVGMAAAVGVLAMPQIAGAVGRTEPAAQMRENPIRGHDLRRQLLEHYGLERDSSQPGVEPANPATVAPGLAPSIAPTIAPAPTPVKVPAIAPVMDPASALPVAPATPLSDPAAQPGGGPLVDRPIASPVATPALPVIDATVAPVGTMRLTEDERLLLREQLRRLPRRAPADH